MESNLVSCIIPVFNGERFLAEAIDSILAQTYEPVEIIVVDDGSTDGTAELIGRYGRQVSYVQQTNQGSATAKNRGVSVAKGDFFAFLDADDLWRPEKIERQMTHLLERPEIDFCFTRFQHFWIPELAEEEERYKDHMISKPLSSYLVSSLLVHRNVTEKFGQFDDGRRGNENMIWFFRAAEQGAVIDVLPDVLTERRIHDQNITKEQLRSGEFIGEILLPIVKAWRDYKRRQPDK